LFGSRVFFAEAREEESGDGHRRGLLLWCGTHLLTRSPRLADALVLKLGTMDDPSQYGGPQMAIFCIDRQPFHSIPEGIPAFDRLPG